MKALYYYVVYLEMICTINATFDFVVRSHLRSRRNQALTLYFEGNQLLTCTEQQSTCVNHFSYSKYVFIQLLRLALAGFTNNSTLHVFENRKEKELYSSSRSRAGALIGDNLN